MTKNIRRRHNKHRATNAKSIMERVMANNGVVAVVTSIRSWRAAAAGST
jgi:hypothetical protein